MRGASMLPCTLLVGPKRTLSEAFRFPCSVPSMKISRASTSACTLPLGATETLPPARRIEPCASPSIRRSEFPEISPRIFRPAPITDEDAETGAAEPATAVFGATATGAGDGATACGPGTGLAATGCTDEAVDDCEG